MYKNVFLAFRPKTLTAALVPCIAGTALALKEKHFVDWKYFFYAIFSALCIQIGTNLVNDAIDFKKGADTDKRLGPKRITQSGVMAGKKVLLLATGFFILAIILGIPLVLKAGMPLVVLGLISVALGYAYTMGPFPLAYTGLGDLFVILFFGIVAVEGMYFVHTLEWSWAAFVLGLQIGCLATVLIAINNFRDVAEDTRASKKTLAVRFGLRFVRFEIAILCYLPFFLGLFWLALNWYKSALLPLLVLSIALKLQKDIFTHGPGEIYNSFLARAAKLHLLFGLLVSLGFVF